MDHVIFLNGVVVNVKSRQPGGTKFESCYGPSTSHFRITHRFWETSLDSLRKNRLDKMATRSATKT